MVRGPLVPLPFSWGIIAIKVSLGVNEGAWVSGRGGGLEVRNARRKEIRMRAVGRRVGSRKEEFGGGM